MCYGYFYRTSDCHAFITIFYPNKFVFGINTDDWQLIRNDPMKPLVNKSLSGNYSPGSTIKPIVALSALENKIISANFRVNCKDTRNHLSCMDKNIIAGKKKVME